MTRSGYCLACGRLREIADRGMCEACLKDEAVRRRADRLVEGAKMRARMRRRWRNMQKH